MRKQKAVIGIVAGLIIVAAGTAAYQVHSVKSDVSLKKSKGVSVKYTAMLGDESRTSSLAALSERDILGWCSSVIIKGEVEKITNLCIASRSDIQYRALATIRVEQVLKGEVAGKEITILMPCGIGDGEIMEDTDVISNLRVGMKGIFLPERYDGNSYEEDCGGSRVYLEELSGYGLPDGMRFAFLETEKGLLYCKDTFLGVGEAGTLDDAEEYIKTQLASKQS